MYKITKASDINSYKVTIMDDEGMPISELNSVHSPFGNCQTFSIRNVYCIFTDKEPKKILRELIRNHQKTQLIVDVKNEFVDKFLGLFLPEDVIFKQPYTNGTGSFMTIILVRTNRFRDAND